MIRPAVLIAIAATASAAVPGQDGSADRIVLAEVRDGDPMALAGRLLPPELREQIVEGSVQRQWLPGQVYRVAWRERGRAVEPDRCEKRAHGIELSARGASGGEASSDTPLQIGKLSSGSLAAILPPGRKATDARCAAATGYIGFEHQPARTLAAYRVLVAAMAAAGRPGTPPFKIECSAEEPEACRDAQRALADLPMDSLLDIIVTCTDAERIATDGPGRVRNISCPPLAPGRPYKAEVAFGPSGSDGRSWRVEFVHHDRWPDTVSLRRSTIIYH